MAAKKLYTVEQIEQEQEDHGFPKGTRFKLIEPRKRQRVTLNKEEALYVIPIGGGSGYTCLGFDVAEKRIKALSDELGMSLEPAARGTLRRYSQYRQLVEAARKRHEESLRTWRSAVELTPELMGKEGKRVEVKSANGETRRFWVGRSTGWMPCHLEIHNTRSHGGGAAYIMPGDIVRVIDEGPRR